MKTKMALMVSAVALGGCVSSVGDGGQGGQGSDTLSSADIADASNATFGVGEPIPIPQDQIPQGNVRYDGIAGFQISDASGPVGVNMTAGVSDEIIGEMTANVNFDDNTGNVEISNLGIYQLPLFEEYETLAPSDIELIGEVSGGFSGSGSVLVDFDDGAADPAILSGDLSGSYSDGTSFSVSGDLEAELAVFVDEASGTTFFTFPLSGEVGDELDIELDGVARESASVAGFGFAAEGGL